MIFIIVVVEKREWNLHHQKWYSPLFHRVKVHVKYKFFETREMMTHFQFPLLLNFSSLKKSIWRFSEREQLWWMFIHQTVTKLFFYLIYSIKYGATLTRKLELPLLLVALFKKNLHRVQKKFLFSMHFAVSKKSNLSKKCKSSNDKDAKENILTVMTVDFIQRLFYVIFIHFTRPQKDWFWMQFQSIFDQGWIWGPLKVHFRAF